MKKNNMGIVGLGRVGSIMKELFEEAIVYDAIKKSGNCDEINQCYVIAKALSMNCHKLWIIWLLDPCIGRSHTFVYKDDRDYGGSRLPKDLSNMICQAQETGVGIAFLEAVREVNVRYHE